MVRNLATGLATCVLLATSQLAFAKETTNQEAQAKLNDAVRKGISFLRASQNDDGSFSPELGPAITSLVTTSLLRSGLPENDPTISKALDYIEQFAQEDGGIYRPGSLYRNYETCVALMCFAELKGDRYAAYSRRAQEFVKNIQWVGGQEDPAYGGGGYGKHKRPDLSNTSFLIDALKSSGLNEDDPAMQRALIFVSRCQNLESQYNTTVHNNKVNDGGFYYTCAAGGSSQAGTLENGGLRSYGSMTYAGLKSLIYAGLKKEDPRVKAAVEWIGKNYDLSKNPGMQKPYDGLYYYYHTFAKSLHALGDSTLQGADGKLHDWRVDLIETLAKKQRANGSWVNESDRWLEGDAELVTAYALLSLSYCR